MRLAVLGSGGDGPGMNAAVRAVVRTALAEGCTILGIEDGFEGLMAGRLRPLERSSVSGIVQRGGCVLGTSRSEAFRRVEGRARAAAVLAEAGVEGLVAIGGNGTVAGCERLATEHGVRIQVVPCSIDGDVYGSDETIGFDTAANTAVESIDRVRDTAEAHRRLFFVEVMGRGSGRLALHVGLAAGADAVLVPELKDDRERLVEIVREAGAPRKRSSIVVVAEGEAPGGAARIAESVRECVEREVRVVVLGYVQRGGRPTVRDRVIASELGAHAVRALLEGRPNALVGRLAGRIARTPLTESAGRTSEPDPALLALLETLAG